MYPGMVRTKRRQGLSLPLLQSAVAIGSRSCMIQSHVRSLSLLQPAPGSGPFQCPDGRYVLEEYLCDGDNDCRDGNRTDYCK